MDLFIEHDDHSYMDSYASGKLFNILKKNHEVFEKSEIKPLRGLGRYKSIFEVSQNSKPENTRFRNHGSLKGLGRIQKFYSNLFELNKVDKLLKPNVIIHNYNYWRGFGKPSKNSII